MLYLLHTGRPEMKNQHGRLCSAAALNLHGPSPGFPAVPVEDRPNRVHIAALEKTERKKKRKRLGLLVFWKMRGNWVNQGQSPAHQLERAFNFICWKKKKKVLLVRSSTLRLPASSTWGFISGLSVCRFCMFSWSRKAMKDWIKAERLHENNVR